jgi:ornithine cyclodeaminase/alanine dehydrogenase
MPPKPGIHTMPDAFIHAMPAFIPSLHSAGIKWVSGYPENFKRGLPYITGLLILNEVETGIPYAVMDCSWITAYRTGAATGLSAKYLARPNSQVAAILACGVQGRTNLEALACLFPLQRVYAYDILPEVQAKFIEEMSAKFKFEIIPAKGPKEAVMASDLVVTSGPILKHPTPTIEKDWLKPGGFGSAVDFDSYWTGPAIAQMDRISTDDHAQFQYYRTSGYFGQTPDPFADLGELAAGLKPRRGSDKERILAINLGLAMDDMAIAPDIYRRAREKRIGTWLPL